MNSVPIIHNKNEIEPIPIFLLSLLNISPMQNIRKLFNKNLY